MIRVCAIVLCWGGGGGGGGGLLRQIYLCKDLEVRGGREGLIFGRMRYRRTF